MVLVVLADGESFAGGWLLLRIGDSYGTSGYWPAGEATIVMGDFRFSKNICTVVGGCVLAKHAL